MRKKLCFGDLAPRLMGLFFMLVFVSSFGQAFFINVEPDPPGSLSVCDGETELRARVVLSSHTTETTAQVKVSLPQGIEYVAGSLVVESSSSGVSMVENGGTANAPMFKISKASALVPTDEVWFRIKRVAKCSAISFINAQGIFKDKIEATIVGQPTTAKESAAYTVVYPQLAFGQPAAQTNALLNTEYTRTFTIKNGGFGCTDTIYFTIDYPNNGIEQVSLTLNVGGTQVALTPTSIVGTKRSYTLDASKLPNGKLCNGDQLIFTEKYKLKTCNATTSYTAGWGCEGTTLCQTITGTASVSMATGIPNISELILGGREGYTDICTPFNLSVGFKNNGSGNAKAAGAYNVKPRLGSGAQTALGQLDWELINIQEATIGGVPITFSGGTSYGIATFDIENKFTTDPDGIGVGLDDLDGDGYYDDLPGGATLTIKLKLKYNCSYSRYNVCPANDNGRLTYGLQGDMSYNTMCSTTVQTSTKVVGTPSANNFLTGHQLQDLTSTSYVPSNVFDGVPFSVRFSVGGFNIRHRFDTENTRYQYEITLPAGVSLSNGGNVKWFNGLFPGATAAAPTVSQEGNILRITSPTSTFGYVTLDLVYNCGNATSLDFPFKLKRLDNIVTGCTTCTPDLLCATQVVDKVVCPSPCADGPATTFVKVERTDASLGWTDVTLFTKRDRASIPSVDLAKALYLDELEVTARATQNGNHSNLYQKMSLAQVTGADANRLTPKQMQVTITRGGTVLSTNTISTFTSTTTSGEQYVVWDLTSALPSGGIVNGDVVETKAIYQVVTNTLPKFDVQMGKEIYFYNMVAGAEKYCNTLIPEMYLVGAEFANANNLGNALVVTSCQSTDIGNGTNHISYRFETSGTPYQVENRPGFKPLTYEITVPTGYVLDVVKLEKRYPQNSVANTITMTKTGTNTYQYTFNEEWGYSIPVRNNYSLILRVFLKPSCETPPSGVNLETKFTYIPYYYYYKGRADQPIETSTKSLPVSYNINTRPAVSLSNQSGNIQATKPIESAVIRMVSTGTSTAPYTWIAIPAKTGITVTGLVDVATGAEVTPISYSGGVWFKLSEAGIASGQSKDYRVKFRYSTCETTSFEVLGGWNCASYPTDPSAYTCSKSSTQVSFTPLSSALQIQETLVPDSQGVGMCDVVEYGFDVLSSGAGNIVGGIVTIKLPVGLSLSGNTVKVEYPKGSGIYTEIPYVQNDRIVTIDLTQISNYPTDGIPGTVNDGGVEANRRIGVNLKVTTNCSFIVGSKFNFVAEGRSACDASTTASTQSAELVIIGTQAQYRVASKFKLNGFDNCAGEVTYHLEQTLISNGAIDNTAEAQIEIPAGYTFKSVQCASAICVTYNGVYQDPNNGKSYVMLKIPGGLDNGDVLNYNVTFEMTSLANYAACGEQQVSVRTMDRKNGITCTSSGQVCPEVLILTSDFDFTYNIKKPTYRIDAISGSLSNGAFVGSVKLTNISDLDHNGINPIKLRLYCADVNDAPSTFLGTHEINTPIAKGETITSNFNITTSELCPSLRIVAVIDDVENCACQDTQDVFALSCFKPGVVNAGSSLETQHGITALGRAGADNGNWPKVRKGAWTVLESKTKGFVVNRLTDVQIAALPSSGLVEGMMVYNITQKCLMINIDGTSTGWRCYVVPTCPD